VSQLDGAGYQLEGAGYPEGAGYQPEHQLYGEETPLYEPQIAEPAGASTSEPIGAGAVPGTESVVEPLLTLEEPPSQAAAFQQPLEQTERASLITDACPYLRSADGLWRSAVSERDLRCWGSAPPLPLAPQTQDRLCRTPAHVRCEIFLEAQQARVTALAADHVSPQQLDGRFGVLVRPTPLILDRPVSITAALPSRQPRTLAGFAVAGLAALVLGILLVALLQGGGGPQATPTPLATIGGLPSPSPSSGAVGTPTVTPSPSTPETSPTSIPPSPPPATPNPQETPPPSLGPGESLPPGVARTYRVHRGDTLASIAQKFGVTPRQILAVNDLGDPPRLLFGQVINIPEPGTQPPSASP
jgi:LysM repeat protein